MPRISGLIFLFCVSCVWAQTMEDPEVVRARLELTRIQSLVETKMLPPVHLEKAKRALADAEDGAVLHRNISQQDLTEEQADTMVSASYRRFERRKQAFDEAKKLVEAGVSPQLSLGAFLRDLDFARKECDLAETRAKLAREINDMARAEEALQARMLSAPSEAHNLADRFDGNGIFNPQIFHRVEVAFEGRFGHPLPVSANGETAVHRALGFDHRGRVDVALHPDQPEGIWLREFLTANRIPFFAFRQAVPGKATGAHIHLGTISTKL